MRVTKQDYENAAKDLGISLDWNTPVKAGDMYLAGRNIGIVLLTAYKIAPQNFIIPIEKNAYCYDTHECVKVV